MKGLIIIISLCLITLHTIALNPSRTYKVTPDKFNMKFNQSTVETPDGAKLNVWEFPSKNEKASQIILISHNGEGNMAEYLRRVDKLINNYHVITYDYRGYGESSEFEIHPYMFVYAEFQTDLATMIKYCQRQYNNSQISLYGWGIGAGLSIGVGKNMEGIQKIIADTPFLSLEDILKRHHNIGQEIKVPTTGYELKNQPMNAFGRSSQTDFERGIANSGFR